MTGLLALLAAFYLAGNADSAAQPLSRDARIFTCSPRTVWPDDVIVLTKHSPDLQELAVQRPGALAPHFLVVALPPVHMRLLMSAEELAARSELHIPVSELTGLEWRVGAQQELIFTVAGTYRFILGVNLESEENAYLCEVEFKPRRDGTEGTSGPKPLFPGKGTAEGRTLLSPPQRFLVHSNP